MATTNHKNWTFPTKKETNRLKHRGGPRSKKSLVKQNKRMHNNHLVLAKTAA